MMGVNSLRMVNLVISVESEMFTKRSLLQSPHFNGVAESVLRLLEAASMAAQLQAKEMYPNIQ